MNERKPEDVITVRVHPVLVVLLPLLLGGGFFYAAFWGGDAEPAAPKPYVEKIRCTAIALQREGSLDREGSRCRMGEGSLDTCYEFGGAVTCVHGAQQ